VFSSATRRAGIARLPPLRPPPIYDDALTYSSLLCLSRPEARAEAPGPAAESSSISQPTMPSDSCVRARGVWGQRRCASAATCRKACGYLNPHRAFASDWLLQTLPAGRQGPRRLRVVTCGEGQHADESGVSSSGVSSEERLGCRLAASGLEGVACRGSIRLPVPSCDSW
jgi:hypothetical protein